MSESMVTDRLSAMLVMSPDQPLNVAPGLGEDEITNRVPFSYRLSGVFGSTLTVPISGLVLFKVSRRVVGAGTGVGVGGTGVGVGGTGVAGTGDGVEGLGGAAVAVTLPEAGVLVLWSKIDGVGVSKTDLPETPGGLEQLTAVANNNTETDIVRSKIVLDSDKAWMRALVCADNCFLIILPYSITYLGIYLLRREIPASRPRLLAMGIVWWSMGQVK